MTDQKQTATSTASNDNNKYPDIELHETFKLADYINQQPRPVQFAHIAPCPKCRERATTQAAQLCPLCNGVGHMARLALLNSPLVPSASASVAAPAPAPTQSVHRVAESYSLCSECHGRGIVVLGESSAVASTTRDPQQHGECEDCLGFEVIHKTSTVFVTIPPGSVNELGRSRVLLQGAGHAQPGTCTAGDIVIHYALLAGAALEDKQGTVVLDGNNHTATIDWLRGHINMQLQLTPDDLQATAWKRHFTAPDGATKLVCQGSDATSGLLEFAHHGVWAYDPALARETAGEQQGAGAGASAVRKAPKRGHLRVVPRFPDIVAI